MADLTKVTNVPLGADIQTYVNAASSGDVLVLDAGTYTLTSILLINKKIHLKGQGRGITIITTSSDIINLLVSTVDGVFISNMTISSTSYLTASTNYIVSIFAQTRLEQIEFLNSTTGTSSRVCATLGFLSPSSSIIKDCEFTSNGAIGWHGAVYMRTLSSVASFYNCNFTGSNGTRTADGNNVIYAGTSGGTIKLYTCSIVDSTNKTSGVVVCGAASCTITCYSCLINGSGARSYDVLQSAGVLNLYGCVLVNGKTLGTVNVYGELLGYQLRVGTAKTSDINCTVSGPNYSSTFPSTANILSTDSMSTLSGGGLAFGGSDGNVVNRWFGGLQGAKENAISGNYAGCLRFFVRPNGTAFVEKMRLTSAGYLGVNTTTPSCELEVAGGIKGSTLNVSGASTLGTVTCTSLTVDNFNLTSAVLITASITNATISKVNNITITPVATSATFTLANGKTLTCNNTLTLAGSDGVTLNVGSNNVSLTTTGPTSLTLPTSGTVTALGNSSTGSGSIALANSPILTTPTLNSPVLSGNMNLNECNLSLKPTLTYNASANGLTITGIAGETMIMGTPVYLKSDGRYWNSKAGTSNTYPSIALTCGATSTGTTCTLLLNGVVRKDTWAWTIGGLIYLAADGTMTQTLPTTSGNCVQILGYALSATHMMFNPDKTCIIRV